MQKAMFIASSPFQRVAALIRGCFYQPTTHMDNEKSFLVYCDKSEQVDLLTDEEAGQLFKALFRYVRDGEILVTDNRTLQYAFVAFKTTIDHNAEKYTRIVEKRREAGRKGNRVRWGEKEESQNIANIANATNESQTIAKVAKGRYNVNVNDNVNVNVNDNESKDTNVSMLDINNNILSIAKACDDRKLQRRKDAFISSLESYRQIYGDAMIDEFADYWTEPNKSQSEMRYELERTWDLSRRLKRWASNNIKQPNNTNNNGNNKQPNQTESPRERSIRELEEHIRRQREQRGVLEEIPNGTDVELPF